MRNIRLIAIVLLLVGASAHAEGFRLGLDYEFERDRERDVRTHQVSVKPGWEFAKGSPIDLVEFLIERSQDANTGNDGVRERETKVLLRLRHSGNWTDRLGYYIQGGIGRSFHSERNYTYATVEPGVKYQFNSRWDLKVGLRHRDAIDGADGERVTKLISQLSFALTPRDELELQVSRGKGDKDLWALGVGYVRQF